MIAGVDEAGRGPVIGPLVVAGLTVEDDNALVNMHVRDSKKLSPAKRRFLAKKVKESAISYEIIAIAASDIDDMRKVMTLNEIEVHAFSRVIKKLKPHVCYVDAADVDGDRFGRDILSQLSFKPEMVSKHKADDLYPIVSAASILAKTTRDAEIEKIAQILEKKISLPLGSGYPADPITQIFLKAWVDRFGTLPPHVRHSWKTAKVLLKNHNTKTLDKF
ncbi:MAG: ribonuclease HII [Candidatus Thermoplasmatota archaeon]|nr:ribonuclease HII [Candidatus Thermoplasmatota archaeon]